MAGEHPRSLGPIAAYLQDLHGRVRTVTDGKVADYIPMLATADPSLFGIAIATVDGEVYVAGDTDAPFTIQSVSKPFMYALALEEHGEAQVLKHVGVEPTGAAFNAMVLDEDNQRPFNPMVNAGAIAVSALVAGDTYAARREKMLALFARFAGRDLTIDEAVFQSERDTGERNRAIANLMKSAAMLGGDTEEILDLYFSQCSVLVTCRDLSLMAATLANGGVQPVTGERALTRVHVEDVLSVMSSCGMYNYAGQWQYEIGIPAKSGVAGSIIAVIPGQVGIAAFSPPLDQYGNSVRAISACKQIANRFGLHVFRNAPDSGAVIRAELRGNSVRSKRRRSAQERDLLDRHGGDIVTFVVQGALFFGSTERLVRRTVEEARTARFVILDMRRVYAADDAARTLLLALHDDVEAQGAELIFVHPDPAQIGAGFKAALEARPQGAVRAFFADRDEALEQCENVIVSSAPSARDQGSFALAGLDIFRGLERADIKLLEGLARPFSYEAGQHILREGEAGRLFFVIVQGSASVRLNVPGEDGQRSTRIASVGVGGTIGEMALLDGGPRSADVVADGRVVCYGFDVEELKVETASRPQLLLTLFANLARDPAERLRLANGHIRAMEA